MIKQKQKKVTKTIKIKKKSKKKWVKIELIKKNYCDFVQKRKKNVPEKKRKKKTIEFKKKKKIELFNWWQQKGSDRLKKGLSQNWLDLRECIKRTGSGRHSEVAGQTKTATESRFYLGKWCKTPIFLAQGLTAPVPRTTATIICTSSWLLHHVSRSNKFPSLLHSHSSPLRDATTKRYTKIARHDVK